MPNYGTPINPDNVPASKPVLYRTVALGFSTDAEAPQLPPGASSRGSNFIAANGALSPRPGLRTSFGTVRNVLNVGAGWVGEYYSSNGTRYPMVLSVSSPMFYSNGSWSALSQTATGSANTMSSLTEFFDATVYYHPTSDEYELCFTNGLVPFTTKPPTATFSTLTNAPSAKYVCAFDSRLVFGYASGFPQRVAWSSRGDPQTYAAPDGGFEELLDMNGRITRVVNADDRVLVFSEREVWYGIKAPFPFHFQWQPLSRTIGTVAPWSVVKTPLGVMFLGYDYNLYLIPPGSTPVRVAPDAERLLRDGITDSCSTLVNGVWMDYPGAYLMTYGAIGSNNSRREHGLMAVMTNNRAEISPIAFGDSQGWSIARLGKTSFATVLGTGGQSVDASGAQRILVADWAARTSGFTDGGVLEFTSQATNDFGSLNLTTPTIDVRYFTLVGNPDPTTRQYVRELRLDYRCASASSLSVRLSNDFGTTYPIDRAVALPAAPYSAQTIIPVGLSGQYVGIEFRHASGHSFALQGATAQVVTLGNG